MKRIVLSLLLSIAAVPPGLAQNQGRVATAIVDLDGRNIPQSDAAMLSDRFRTEVFNTRVFDVLEREKMGEILKEQGFQQTGACDDACMVEIGKLVGVQKIIAGSISHAGAVYSVNARLIDVGTGRVEQTATYDHDGELQDLLTSKMRVVALSLAYRYLNAQTPDTIRSGAAGTPGAKAAGSKAEGAEAGAAAASRGAAKVPSYLPYAVTGGLAAASVLAIALPSTDERATSPTTGFAFLRIPVAARAAALGEAVVALADDPSGLGYNPAGLPLMRSRQAAAGYLNYLSGIQLGAVSFIQPVTGDGTAGAALTYLNSGTISETTLDDPLGENLGTFSYTSLAVTAGYGRCFDPQFYAGAALKGIYERVKDYSAAGAALDLGAIYEVDLQSLGDRLLKPGQPGNYGTSLALGAAVQNIGFAAKAFVTEKAKMPLQVRAGLAYRPFMDRLTVALAAVKPLDASLAFQCGAEYWIRGLVALRLGYNGLSGGLQNGSDTDAFSGMAAGLGVRYRGYRLDFAYTPSAGLGNPLRVGIAAEF